MTNVALLLVSQHEKGAEPSARPHADVIFLGNPPNVVSLSTTKNKGCPQQKAHPQRHRHRYRHKLQIHVDSDTQTHRHARAPLSINRGTSALLFSRWTYQASARSGRGQRSPRLPGSCAQRCRRRRRTGACQKTSWPRSGRFWRVPGGGGKPSETRTC